MPGLKPSPMPTGAELQAASLDEAELAEPAPADDASPLTFEHLYALYFRFTWRVLLHLGVPRGALDDAAQELWLVVHRRLQEFEQRSQLKTWLFGIALNVARNHRRSSVRRARGELPPPEHVPSVPDPEMLQVAQEAWDHVQAFLETLDEQRRALFVCALLEQLSAQETAEATGMAVAAVYHRTRSLRQSFKHWLRKQEASHAD